MKKKKILGAGIAGIGAYYADNQCDLYEQSDKAGGLCNGFQIGEYHFDNAVHLSFTNNQFVRDIFDKISYYKHAPEAYSWFHEKWLRHPAQNNLFPCSVEEKIEAIKGFINRGDATNIDDFATWSKNQYGEWLYQNLFKPYNEKYWCIPLENLGINWIGNRIYRPSLDEVLYGCFTSETPNTYYAKEMRYPKYGGYFAFVKNIVDDADKNGKLQLNRKATRIDAENKIVYFKDGSETRYDELYSSIPLPEMAEIVDQIPCKLKEKAKNLENTGVVLVSIGFNRVVECDKIWFYFYDKDIMASRAYMPSIKSDKNVPYGCSSVQFEIYYNMKKSVPNKDECIDNCLYAMRKIGLANQEDVVFIDYRVQRYANVIFKKDTEEIANELTEWLGSNDIIPIGRFGEWKYYWSDQAFLSGYNAVRERMK